jgi:hypothetical protein
VGRRGKRAVAWFLAGNGAGSAITYRLEERYVFSQWLLYCFKVSAILIQQKKGRMTFGATRGRKCQSPLPQYRSRHAA